MLGFRGRNIEKHWRKGEGKVVNFPGDEGGVGEGGKELG